MKTFFTLLIIISNYSLLSGCASVPREECEQAIDIPIEITTYIQGIGGIVDADMLPSICLDRS